MGANAHSTNASERYLLGIDGGGTTCRALLVSSDNRVLGRGKAGPANPLRDPARSFRSIAEASKIAFGEAGLSDSDMQRTVVGIGLAGVNVPAAYEAIRNWRHPYHSLHLTTDMQIACYGSHGSADGAVIISGTGCSGYSSISGRNRVHGGFGFPFGDKGGSAWIGLCALRAALLAHDSLGPPTLLEDSISLFYQETGIGIVERLANAQPYEFGQLAPLVFTAVANNDEVARAIVVDNADHISAMARVISRLSPVRLSFVGGLSATIEPWLATDVRELLSPALHTPLEGAILYARDRIEHG